MAFLDPPYQFFWNQRQLFFITRTLWDNRNIRKIMLGKSILLLIWEVSDFYFILFYFQDNNRIYVNKIAKSIVATTIEIKTANERKILRISNKKLLPTLQSLLKKISIPFMVRNTVQIKTALFFWLTTNLFLSRQVWLYNVICMNLDEHISVEC